MKKSKNDNKVTTIKDVAEKSGYSIATVHRALNNKEGLSEETRKTILDIANELNYTNNYVASALSRKKINIAVVLPNPEGLGKYYFRYMINGIRDCNKELYSYNINLIEYFYEKDGSEAESQLKTLERLYLEKNQVLSGLIIAPVSKDEMLITLLQAFEQEGTKIILVDDDLYQVKRLCCVAPSDEYIGNLGAELLCGMINKSFGKILLAAGNPMQTAHLLNNKGFVSYMKEHRPDVKVIFAEDGVDSNASYENLKKLIQENDDIIAAYSVRAKNSIPLCNAVRDAGKANEIIIVGSDLFAESEKLLNQGILSAVIYKNPYQKGYLAFKILFDAVIKGIIPNEETVYVPFSIILRSNLRFFKEFI
ncbi:MAG: LacI family DNA-binding transcriptional regulator [Otoolea sp.]